MVISYGEFSRLTTTEKNLNITGTDLSESWQETLLQTLWSLWTYCAAQIWSFV